MKWLKDKDEKDKKEIVTNFEKLSDDNFEIWLLKQSKWKNDVTKKNIPSICDATKAFVIYHSTDRLAVQVIVDEKSTELIMRNLTFEELFRQIYNNLEWKYLREMRNKDQRLELADSNDEIIESDEMVKTEFEKNKRLFKVLWSPIRIEKIKVIKNALVIMIAISEYIDNEIWPNLPNVKEQDVGNFKQLFEQNLGYEFVCNTNFKMNKEDVKEFLIEVITSRELVKNKQKYDALIVIVSGHGDKEDVLITSDGKKTQINSIRTLFDCDRMSSFQNFPKIFFIDACRGTTMPKKENNNTASRGRGIMHDGEGFLMVWSTTSGYSVSDLSIFSESIKCLISQKYQNETLRQMLNEIRNDIKKKDLCYCLERSDTIDYDIIFQQRISFSQQLKNVAAK
ncbi:caspase 3, apoptosis-related cysteine protease a [Reticulomyxa filosa]|uniref:Caspase 3, apoptosis-related cysteine protease a n=1 Tax=Reticulomyxa filosa TaxID=46433 RepID=X6NJ25_RETFI|nr:caspase 3, apoptosis-related cysteine protease a [Reticulomyxa filosa]|eukprot:ETO25878.1 caspase 3, apoptosis-related cysteine protease a [Reticulomyxa filosa]